MSTSSPHPVDIHVGKQLRLKRTILGMSQDAVGTAIGVTFQQIQKYERGINRIGSSRLYDFSKLLNVPVSYFFEGLSSEQNTSDYHATGMAESESDDFEHEQMASRETMEMMRAYYKIDNPVVRKALLELIKTLASTYTKNNPPSS